jgi:uncharacterized protein YutE (UPF0331/DUF86 family)
VEIIVDIGNHILSEVFHSSAGTYKDVIFKLGDAGIIPKDFANDNLKMADFRNLIIHGYASVDLDQVYQNIQKAPDIFRQFAKYYVEFLDREDDY